MKAFLATLFAVAACLLTGSFALAAEKVETPESCAHCGMDRTKFAHSRMIVEYEDGTATGVCSLNCAVIDMDANSDRKIKMVQVADYNTKKLIDAEKAFWVIGGEKKGVMTMTAKWAFEKKEDAEKFITQFGGTPGTYDEALRLAREHKRGKGMKKTGAMDEEGATQAKKKCGCCSH